MSCILSDAAPEHAGRTPELADIFNQFAGELPPLLPVQSKAVRDIVKCRTPAMGGHMHQCDHCGHQVNLYNSCRNRHCPKCQSLNQARWLDAREKDLLPVEYFHVVFTIPNTLHSIFRSNTRVCLNLLFASVSETLQEVALNPERLGAKIGFIAVLHTWTQTLLYHPHLHCIVPGGGLSPDGTNWLACDAGFFLPVPVLSAVFRGKLLSKFEAAIDDGKIPQSGTDAKALLRKAARPSWVVYCKPPFAGPKQVLRYLGRYTHRIAISNHRIVSMRDKTVTFRYRDRADGNKQKLMTMDAVSFLKRFLAHIMPSGFMRIRHFGFLANAVRKKALALCRAHLKDNALNRDDDIGDDDSWQKLFERLTGIDVTVCPVCSSGRLICRETIPSKPRRWLHGGRAAEYG